MCTGENCISAQRTITGSVDISSSSNRRVVPGMDKFSGTTVRLQYGVDGSGMRPGEKHEGWLCFTTSIGEYKLPFVIRAQKEEIKSVAGKVTDLDSFVNIAKDDFREAYRLFTDSRFRELLDQKDKKQMALYKGLSRQPGHLSASGRISHQHREKETDAHFIKDRQQQFL